MRCRPHDAPCASPASMLEVYSASVLASCCALLGVTRHVGSIWYRTSLDGLRCGVRPPPRSCAARFGSQHGVARWRRAAASAPAVAASRAGASVPPLRPLPLRPPHPPTSPSPLFDAPHPATRQVYAGGRGGGGSVPARPSHSTPRASCPQSSASMPRRSGRSVPLHPCVQGPLRSTHATSASAGVPSLGEPPHPVPPGPPPRPILQPLPCPTAHHRVISAL